MCCIGSSNWKSQIDRSDHDYQIIENNAYYSNKYVNSIPSLLDSNLSNSLITDGENKFIIDEEDKYYDHNYSNDMKSTMINNDLSICVPDYFDTQGTVNDFFIIRK